MKQQWHHRHTLLMALSFVIFHLLSGPAGAQGLPLIRNFTAADYGGHNRCYDIETCDDGTVLVANFEGLLCYDRSRWRMLYTPDISRVTDVRRDSAGTVWVGGYDFSARLHHSPNGELLLEPNDAAQTALQSLNPHALDDAPDGIIQTVDIDGGMQVKVRKNSGLVVADSQGRELYTITEADGLCSNQVAAVAYDGHGLLWGATAHGIFAIEMPSPYSYFLAKDGFSGEVLAITAFNGHVYAGGTNGVYRIAPQKCERLAEINNICWALCPYAHELLAATSSGIFSLAPGGSITRLTAQPTTALLVDGDHVLAGEPDGVWSYHLAPGDASQRTRVSPLKLATTIKRNAQGGLYLQNVHGQTEGTPPPGEELPLDALTARLSHPLSHIEATTQYRYGDQVWVGGDEVLAIVDTSRASLARLALCPTLRFRTITIGADSVLWGGYGPMPSQLPQLDSRQRHLHFYFTLPYAPLSGATLYRYRLNDNDWSSWSEKHDVEFLNLPYGAFTLSVQAQLASGELSEVTSVSFSIAYPLLMRWYMVALYFLLLAGVVWLLFRYRLKRLERDKLKLERIVEERTADLRNAQHELVRQEKMASVGKLTEGLIDRILNPMNYIINFSKMSIGLLGDLKENIDHNKDSINADDYEDTLDVLDMLSGNLQQVDQYGQNTTRTLKAMEEMLKDRTGGYVDTDLLPVLQQNREMLATYFASDIEQYHISTAFQLPSQPLPLHGNPDLLSKTIMSLLGNAVYAVVKKAQKAAPVPPLGERGGYIPEITLTASLLPPKMGPGGTGTSEAVIQVRDNGIGIEEKILGKVFDPFFTTKTTDEAAGVGLYLSREIIQNHGGDISVASVKDEYTEFTITLPLNL